MTLLEFCVLSSFFCSTHALHFSISPPDNAFFLHSHSFASTNFTNRVLYLQRDCPFSTDQRLSVSSGNRVESSRLFSSLPNLHCAVSVRLVQDVVKLDRPYVDILAVADAGLLTFLKQIACVTVQITNPTAETVSTTCHLSPFEESKQHCLLRIQIPHKWFGSVGHNSTMQTLSLSHTVSSTCNVPFYDRPQTPINVLPYIESAQAHTLSKHDEIDLSLLSRANISFSLGSLNSLFVHLSYNSTDEFGSVEIRLFIDSRIEVVAVNPLSADDWTVRVQSAQRPEVYTSFFCVPTKKVKSWDGYVFSLLVKMKGNLSENKKLERGEEGAEASLHWEIRRRTAENSTKEVVDRVATRFKVTPDSTYALVPVAKNMDIINSGILSGRQSSTSMRVYTVSLGGSVRDVTTSSHCISTESKVLKTSPTCTTVYVDGSEMRGMSQIEVHVSFEQWTTSIPFTVWFPRLPVTLWLKDPVLNTVTGWPIATWKDLKEGKHHRRAAKQFSCSTRFQQSEVTVLASFQVSDERTGERVFLSGHRDVHFDVTSLAADSILSLDRNVAVVKNFNNRILIQAVGPGSTRIVLKRPGPTVDYGGATVVVSEEPVTVSRVTAIPIVEMNINVDGIVGKRAQYTVAAEIETVFSQRYQHGSFFYQLQYSDDATEPLDDITSADFVLGATSTDERVLALSHKGKNMVEIIALDDLTDLAVEFELRAPAHCLESDSLPLASTLVPIHLQFSDNDSSRLAVAKAYAVFNGTVPSTAPLPPESQSHMLIILVILLCLFIAVKFLYNRARNFNGYEKLVAPLLSRLSSSSSSGGAADENTKEWIWLSKSRIDTNSIGSRYSQKSTMNLPEQSSPSYDENTHTSISYRGSEISVFISPTPVVTVNAERGIAGGSWRSGGKSRTRAARHALVDSSSDHNLARVVARTGSWKDDNKTSDAAWQNHTWNTKRRNMPSNNLYDGMRESIA